jgi:fatty acid desaturase
VCVPLTTQLLLVPYFSWQRSHGVHHSRTNHITEGETHVPSDAATPDNQALYSAAAALGEGPFTIIRLIVTLVLLAP